MTTAICREARTTFGADYGVLWRIADGELELVRSDPRREEWPRGLRVPLADFPGLRGGGRRARRLVRARRPRRSPRATASSAFASSGIRSSLRSPIAIGGRAELILVVSWQTTVDEPDPTTIAIVRRFADQAGLAFGQLERRRAEERAAARADETERLQEVTSALSLAASRGDVGDTCLTHALRFVGAEAGFVVLTGAGGTSVQMISNVGYSEDALEAWSALGLDADVPFARAIASGEPVWALTRDEMDVFTGAPALDDAGWISVPLKTPAGIHGALHVSLHEPRELSDGERSWLQTVVSQCALALERSQLYDEEQRLRERSERLQRTTAKLSNAVTLAEVADVVVEAALENVDAASASLYAVNEERQVARPLASAWRADPARRIGGGSRSTRVPRSRTSCAVGLVVRAAGATISSRAAQLAHRPARRRQADRRRPRARLGTSRSRSTPTTASSSGRWRARERRLSTARGTSSPSARSRRPSSGASCPRPSHVWQARRSPRATCRARRRSTSEATGSTPSSCAMAGSGSSSETSSGKGVHAAASMGQLRNALRAISIERLKPPSALARLDRLASDALDASFATVVYAIVDPRAGVLRFSSAGHPPPVIAYPGRSRRAPRGRPRAPARHRPRREVPAERRRAARRKRRRLSTRTGSSSAAGARSTRGSTRSSPRCETGPKDAEQLLEHVLEQLVEGAERADDIAILAARFLPVAPQPLDLEVREPRSSLHLVRDAIRTWLEGTELDAPEAEDLLLAAWEVCANAIEHATIAFEEIVRIRAALDDSRIRIVVDDTGRFVQVQPRPDRGLGLRLAEHLSSALDITTTEDGTTVALEKASSRGRRPAQKIQMSSRMMTMSASAPPPMYTVSPFVRLPRSNSPSASRENRVCRSRARVRRSVSEQEAERCRLVERRRARSEPASTSTSRTRCGRGSSEAEAEEIAARTVNKERARSGEARTSSKLSREDISSGRRGGFAATARARAAARATSSTRRRRIATSAGARR